MVFDLSDTKSILNAAELILKHSGHVDILINNAGISYRGTIIDTGLDVDKKVMETNYFGPIALTKGTWDSRYRGDSGWYLLQATTAKHSSHPVCNCIWPRTIRGKESFVLWAGLKLVIGHECTGGTR